MSIHLFRMDADLLAALARPLEGHKPVCRRKQGIISADTDIRAWVDARAALAQNDVASRHKLTAEALDAQTLCIRITTVAAGTATFFVCHGNLLLLYVAHARSGVDRLDLQAGEVLAM